MLPKVNREDLLNQNSIETSSNTGTNSHKNNIVKLLSEVPVDNGGGSGCGGGMGRSSKSVRRPISTKSAHVAPIPVEAIFLSPPLPHHSSLAANQNDNLSQQNRPYLPYSASSPTRTRHRFQINQQNMPTSASSHVKWKGGGESINRYKSNNINRGRARSDRAPGGSSLNGKTWSARGDTPTSGNPKSMPFLVPRTAKPRISSSTSSKLPTSDPQQQQSRDEKICKKLEQWQTSGIHLVGGMMTMGTGKSGVLMNGVGGGGPMPSSLTKDRVQVCRTKEERERNPDTIRLDKRGVRVFPDIGGGESTTLKLLSLQHNLITRLENVPLLSQLVVLDLYDNRVERITGLQGLPSLRVLLLGKNRIKRIEGLDNLKRLEILDLHGNQLRYVDNLGPLSALRVLNLAGNMLRNIRSLGPYGMSSLTELNVKRNRIKNLEGLQKAPHLKKLLLANNDLQNVSSLAPLRKLMYLNELVIDPNPLIRAVGWEYQSQVLTLFPNLGTLDKNLVTEKMRMEAKLWHKKKLEEEVRKKMEEERLRQEMTQTVGPPGSREQAIYQARRRWESLRNFVKSGPPVAENEAKIGKKSSMKKVVAVVAEMKAKRQGDLLYPPATLDLEEFPDGQERLDQTESLMSCEDNLKEGFKEQEQFGNKKTQSAPKPTEDVLSSCATNDKTIPEIRIPEINANEMKIQRLENAFNVATMEETKAVSIIVDKNESPEETQQEDNPHSFLDSQRPSSCSARSNSAKVAVVRPLVHRSDAGVNETSSEPEDNTELMTQSLSSPKDFEYATMCPQNVGVMPAAALKSCDDEVKVAKSEPFNENLAAENTLNPEITSGISMQRVREVTPEIDVNLSSTLPPMPSLSHPSSFLPQVTEYDEDNSQEENVGQQPSIQNESARVKSKLLKHLRSISLDSYPHPFLQPGGGQKTGDAEGGDSPINSASPMIHSDNDDGVEEDDDNDTEVVQDHDCDDEDAYSIATSTCTTVTSGSTPRKSSTVMATTNRLMKNGVLRKQTFPRTRSQRIKLRDRAAKLFGSTSDLSPRSSSGTATMKRVNSGKGTRCLGDSINGTGRPPAFGGRILRRCDSAASLTTSGLVSPSSTSSLLGCSTNGAPNSGTRTANGNDSADNQGGSQALGPSPFRKQGVDFLVEIEGKILNVFGQGGLRHALTAFASNVTCHVITTKFHYISYDSIIPFFGKLRQVYPSLEHFHLRANNLCTLAQLDSLSDLQGLTSLFISKEGNPIVNHPAWAHYASYRLSHWGLQIINGKEVCSEYRGAAPPAAQAKCFESLGFLALSCLPQTALTPLAKRLHMLHCFCCCSPSTSSDESTRKFANPHNRLLQSPSQSAIDHSSSNGNFCTAWDDDPVLLDVIGKEALVYCPSASPPEIQGDSIDNNCVATTSSMKPSSELASSHSPQLCTNSSVNNDRFCAGFSNEKKRAETLGNLVNSGVEIVEKVDMLEKVWPSLMTQVIQDVLMDYRFMDSYMKKELKKCQDITLINQQQQQQPYHHHHGHQHGKKVRH